MSALVIYLQYVMGLLWIFHWNLARMQSYLIFFGKKAIKFFEINDGISILGDQPGVGKSCPAMSYAVKYKFKTLIVCPATLKHMWRNEIIKFTNEKAFIYKFKPKKKSKTIAFTKEESLFHITNYDSIETYIKLEYRHKCSGNILQAKGGMGKCAWEQTDLIKNYKKCPICENTGSVKSRITGVVYFDDKFDHEINPNTKNKAARAKTETTPIFADLFIFVI